jgi:hypothetical protein
MILVGVLVGLAPLLHAICIAPPAGGVGSSVSHVMADGTVMNVALKTPAATTAVIDIAPASTLGETLGAIILVAGLTLLTILGVRFCRGRAALVAGISWARLRNILPVPAFAWPPTDVSLLALGISRT